MSRVIHFEIPTDNPSEHPPSIPRSLDGSSNFGRAPSHIG
jgi:hypothetical protein